MIDSAASKRPSLSFRILGAVLIGCVVGNFLFLPAIAETESKSRDDDQLISNWPKQSINVPIHLYFADRNNTFLKSEQRVIRQPDEPLDFGRSIVEALIEGPQKGLVRTIPKGTELNAFYIDPEHVCYVDLSEAVKNNHPGGSNSELLTIYSVVNSLILNVSEIKQVKILIDGNESPTLAGHIDLQLPFKAHMLIIR